MAEIAAQGRVIEARSNFLVIRVGIDPMETLHDGLREHDAKPGDYVWIYDDGQVEVRARHEPVPNIEIPSAPQPDHS